MQDARKIAADYLALADAPQPPPLKICRNGRMIYLPNDVYIGRSLRHYGEFSHAESEMISQLAGPGDQVIEVGSNIGAHTISLARRVGPSGRVLAFEPQRVVFQILCANLALNGLFNVDARQEALAALPGTLKLPPLDYHGTHNFGGVSLSAEGEGETVQATRLDDLDLPAPSLIKIDAEGMESEVLAGGQALIARHRPLLYVENDRREKSPALIRQIMEMGYSCWWHLPPLFNPANFDGNPVNVFGGTVSINMLCLPAESRLVVDGLRKITAPEDHWRS